MGIMLLIVAAFCCLGIYFFMKGYRNGLAMKTLKVFTHIPGLRRKARKFVEDKRETVERIDSQIAELHRQNKRTFYLSLFLEFAARIVGCLEIWFIFMILTDSVSFWDCILIQAFTSLFANLFLFHAYGNGHEGRRICPRRWRTCHVGSFWSSRRFAHQSEGTYMGGNRNITH